MTQAQFSKPSLQERIDTAQLYLQPQTKEVALPDKAKNNSLNIAFGIAGVIAVAGLIIYLIREETSKSKEKEQFVTPN